MHVIAFGTFDSLHQGHHYFFRQARSLGDNLTVVVARDSWIRGQKLRQPREHEAARLQQVRAQPEVDEAMLGDEWPSADPYRLLGSLTFDIVALGYDQQPAAEVVRAELRRRGKGYIRIERLKSYHPGVLKSSQLHGRETQVYDLHLHSAYSDGDLAPAALVKEAARRKLAGVSLTDHNGVWGFAEAARAALLAGIVLVEGIEISARAENFEVHVLGYSRKFNRSVLRAGLQKTRDGYRDRVQEMVRRCREAGFDRISFAALERSRAGQADPAYGSYDVARELTRRHGLGTAQARRLTTSGGACHVPYGNWAFSIEEAVGLVHRAGGVAALAHPGLVSLEHGAAALDRLLCTLGVARLLDGLEAHHPYHSHEVTRELQAAAAEHGWFVTGGSDWHGPGRYEQTERAFGRVGLAGREWRVFLDALNAASA
jgi:3',5'-nucleoside bisphosphate phosphatase